MKAKRYSFALLSGILLMQGCIAHDASVKKYTADRISLDGPTGLFLNEPIYTSKAGGFSGSSDFISVFGYARSDKAKLIRINADREKREIHFELLLDDQVVFEQSFDSKDGLKFTEEGRVILPTRHMTTGGRDPGVGYGNNRYTLFVNENGNLVVVQSGTAFGLLYVVPFFIDSNLMTIYPRVRE